MHTLDFMLDWCGYCNLSTFIYQNLCSYMQLRKEVSIYLNISRIR